MIPVKQSTAVVLCMGPFVDKTDGITFETGLAGTSANQLEHTSSGILISKNGGTLAARHATATASTYDAYGMYKVTLDTTDTATLGILRVCFGNNDAVPTWVDCVVLAANIYDSLVGGGDILDVSMTQILGTAVSTPATAGILDVNVKNIDNDAASASGTVTFPNATLASTTNITAGTITTATTATNVTTVSSGAISEASYATTAGSFAPLMIVDRGTAQSATGTTLVLRSAAAFADSELVGATVVIRTATTGAGQSRKITANVGSTDTVTVDTWTTTPTGTITYDIFGTAKESASLNPVDVTKWNGTAVSSPATAGIPDVNVKNINNVAAATPGAAGGVFIAGTNAATTITTALTTTFTGNLTGSVGSVTGAVGSVTGAVGSVTGNVGGNVTGSVGSVASGGITRASLAADTGLVTIRSNTATAGAGTTITLDASASAVDNFYNNTLILLTGGTGVGQARFVTAYVGATKVATVATWVTNPDNTTTFAILPFDAVAGASAPTAAQVATAVWQDLLAGSDFSTASSIGKLLKDDIDAQLSLIKTKTDFLPSATAGAAGGVAIAGSNAATTFATLTVTGLTTLTGNVLLSDGLRIPQPSTANRPGFTCTGNGTGAGWQVSGGATGAGVVVTGGATSGDGISVTTTSGHGVNLAPVGSSKHGLFATGGNAGTSDGISAVAGTGGVPIRGDITGNVTGNVSGSVGSVTGAVGSVTGNVGGNVTGSAGDLLKINGSSVAAVNLARSARAIVVCTVGAASTTTSIVTSSMSPAAVVADQFKGRIVIFDDTTTTANLRGQATDITANTSGGVLTVTALTTAPASGDTFTIL